jgi:hypothetical protein
VVQALCGADAGCRVQSAAAAAARQQWRQHWRHWQQYRPGLAAIAASGCGFCTTKRLEKGDGEGCGRWAWPRWMAVVAVVAVVVDH